MRYARWFHNWMADSEVLTRRQFLIAFCTLFLLVTLALTGERLLVTANRHRIHDIQASRLHSCRETYHAFLIVFRPFFPGTSEEHWLKKQRHDWEKLRSRVSFLVRQCSEQTQPKESDGSK